MTRRKRDKQENLARFPGPAFWGEACRVVGLTLLILIAPLKAQASGGAEPWSFFVLADPQYGMYCKDQEIQKETENLEKVIRAANRLRPTFIVVCGDLVNRSDLSFETEGYLRVARKLNPGIPFYNVPGNHDVGNEPTPASIARYCKTFGPDYFTFQAAGLVGIVINSSLLHHPESDPEDSGKQERWLNEKLKETKPREVQHVVVFQHHPWFLQSIGEPDGYFNLPLAIRKSYLGLFEQAGIRYVFSGHTHQPLRAAYGGLDLIINGPVGKPLGGARSGIGVVAVLADSLEYSYYSLESLPEKISPHPQALR